MAVGDVVGVLSAIGVAVQLQPAVGVSIMLANLHTSVGGTNTPQLRDATPLFAQSQVGSTSMNSSKFFINNTKWLQIGAVAGETTGAGGIQIQ